jgi:hypothetical protein
MANHETAVAVAEVGSASTDVAVGRLSELPAFDPHDPAMVFMAQIAHRWNMAKMLVKSQMIPQKTPEAAIAVMLKAHELGVTPMVGFANMFFFDGKLGMSADLMTALFIQKAGGQIQVLEWTDKVCRIRFSRAGWEPSEVEYTEEDAKAAGLLGKQNWKNRKAMLSARCRSMGVRLLAPDVFAGTYSTEELADMREDGGLAFVEAAPARSAAGLNARLVQAAPRDFDEFDRVGLAGEAPREPARPADTEPADDPEQLEALTRAYFATLRDRGMSGEKDRRAFQKRVVGKSSTKDWTVGDFRAALRALDEIPVDDAGEEEQPEHGFDEVNLFGEEG